LGLVLASVALGVTVINDFIKDAPVAKKTLDTLQVSFLPPPFLLPFFLQPIAPSGLCKPPLFQQQ
jgi:hypothetical protein